MKPSPKQRARSLWAAALPGPGSRTFALIVLCAGAGGCASLELDLPGGGGEQVSYRVWNDTGHSVIERPMLRGVRGGPVLYTNLQSYAPGWRWTPSTGGQAVSAWAPPDTLDTPPALPRLFEGAFATAPAGHRVPREVRLHWQAPAAPGQPLYGGTEQPSVVVSLRERIPAAVLAQVAGGWRYRLDIAIGAHPERPTVHWRLVRHEDDGPVEVRRSRGW
jgi:hypothetical protein